MFFLNKGYQWKIDNNSVPNGIIINASSMPYGQIERRLAKKNVFKGVNEILFDPQLHLFKPSAIELSDLNSNLSTYPWFSNEAINYESSVINLTEYRRQVLETSDLDSVSKFKDIERKVTECFNFQNSIPVTGIIAPTPLIINKNLDFSNYIQWINSAIKIYKDSTYNKELYISVNLSEEILSNQPVNSNLFLQTILDNLTALDNCVSGFYITFLRNQDNQYLTDRNVINSLFEICFILGHCLNKKVIINTTDVFGFVCLGAGATSFATGYTNKEKRLFWDDFKKKQSQRGAYPRFYSHTVFNDYLPYRDLNKINDISKLDIFNNDITFSSKPLFDSLLKKSVITTWKESSSNTAAAIQHKIQLLNAEANALNDLNIKDKSYIISKKLSDAAIFINDLNSRTIYNPLSKDGSHIVIWKKCFDKFISTHSII